LKPESALWQKCKRNLSKITWSRIETVYTPGVPDLLGYHESCGFFTVELKAVGVNKSNIAKAPVVSPHQIAWHINRPLRTFILVGVLGQRLPKLYEGTQLPELAACSLLLDACIPGLDSWDAIQDRLLLVA
jgi:hypothetical protein|tara:strand:+ start:3714 stop:4106 length:393 start_codon:yes stop_codon:yes gene_type:complete